jgi:hypothetical protein
MIVSPYCLLCDCLYAYMYNDIRCGSKHEFILRDTIGYGIKSYLRGHVKNNKTKTAVWQ